MNAIGSTNDTFVIGAPSNNVMNELLEQDKKIDEEKHLFEAERVKKVLFPYERKIEELLLKIRILVSSVLPLHHNFY